MRFTYLVCPKCGRELLREWSANSGSFDISGMDVFLEVLRDMKKLGNCRKCGSPLSIEESEKRRMCIGEEAEKT